jgi:non-canonical (house-cleaning) NTP pyrophosphatase
MNFRVLLSSPSQIKYEALEAHLVDVGINAEISRLTNTPTTSFVQPRSELQALACLVERVNAADESGASDGVHFVVGIENFVVESQSDVDSTDTGRVFHDCVAMAFHDRATGELTYRVNRRLGVVVPECVASQLRSPEKLTITVGQMLEPHFGRNDAFRHDDWYIAVGNVFGRAHVITAALAETGFFAAPRFAACRRRTE